MPQLDLNPWFATLVFSWIVLLGFVVPKVLSHTFSGSPAPQDAHVYKATPWAWAWA